MFYGEIVALQYIAKHFSLKTKILNDLPDLHLYSMFIRKMKIILLNMQLLDCVKFD